MCLLVHDNDMSEMPRHQACFSGIQETFQRANARRETRDDKSVANRMPEKMGTSEFDAWEKNMKRACSKSHREKYQ